MLPPARATSRPVLTRAALSAALLVFALGIEPPAAPPRGRAAAAEPTRAPRETRTTHNAQVASTSRADVLTGAGAGSALAASGEGVLIGDWDDGHARDTHLALAGRVRAQDVAGLSAHATHTTGSAIGAGEAAGMAPAARVWAHDWSLDVAEIEQAAPFLSHSNHPYGLSMGWAASPACPELPSWWGGEGAREDARFGKYLAPASDLDRVVHRTGLPTFWPAGNERVDRGVAAGEPHYHVGACGRVERDAHLQETTLQYDTVGGQAMAKNVITVGALHKTAGDADGERLWPLDLSAFGPTDDGRIKPELAMAGDAVRSSSNGGDDAYQSFEGTSSSVSAASGVAALVVELYRRARDADLSAAAMRALLVHATREAGADPGPDYRLGYGVLDAQRAAELIAADAARQEGRHILEAALGGATGTGEAGASLLELRSVEAVPPGADVRVVLAWTDPPAAPNVLGLDDSTPTLIHDLDLELIAPDGTVHFPWSLDPAAPAAPASATGPNHRDNLEVIDLAGDAGSDGDGDGDSVGDGDGDGRWTLRVRAPSLYREGETQAFALISSIAFERPDQPLLQVRRTVEISYPVGSLPQPVSVPIGNLGAAALSWQASSAAPELSLSPASGAAGDTLSIELASDAFTEPGETPLQVRIDSNDPRGATTLGVLVRVTCEPDCAGLECGADPRCGELCGRCERGRVCQAGSCAPIADSCPAGELGSQLGGALVQGTLADDSGGASAGSCGGGGSPEQAFTWSAPRAGDYVVSTRGSSADTVLHVRAAACSGAELGCNDDSGGSSSSLVLSVGAGEQVGLVVETDAPAAPVSARRFDLGVQPSRCPDVDLGSQPGTTRVRASTFGGVDHSDGSCGGEDSEDVAFGWTAPESQRYTFKLFDPRYQGVLYVRDGDCAGRELGCSPAPDVGPVELNLDAGQRVVVIIDGRDGAAGEFELDILDSADRCGSTCTVTRPNGGCACDPACVAAGDCCIDACDTCGACRCLRQCDGRSCGDDGCGGSCGDCGAASRCRDGRCAPDPCEGVRCDACSQCVEGRCEALPDGAACEDGDLCSVLDVCDEGACAGTPRDCNDGLACTVDRCVPETGRCEPEPTDECARCDGGVDCPRSLVDASAPGDGGDGAVDRDAGADGVPADGAADPGEDAHDGSDDGCGCRVGRPPGAPPVSGWLLLLVALLWRARAASARRHRR